MLATPQQSAREFARNVGCEQTDRQWILTPYDSWEKNPFYSGPNQPHPEDFADDISNVQQISELPYYADYDSEWDVWGVFDNDGKCVSSWCSKEQAERKADERNKDFLNSQTNPGPVCEDNYDEVPF